MTDQQLPATPNVAPAPGMALPCPFCEGHAASYFNQSCDCCGQESGVCYCTSCGAEISHETTEAEAITAWNTRTPDPALAAENARLIALVGEMREALVEVDEWICGWSPDFTQDDEWPETRAKVYRALASKAAVS